ncbi:flagellar hook-basal body complex protein [Alcaligenaceae bacterium CGII-47]|nr:flagellar hook-basal body complex protein [Alcaligenaceae bacterium CGII-47]
MGFGQGLSGLNAAAQNLDVIGNNIANSGTVGFKTGTATFADVYANSRVGLGVQVASVNQRFTTGIVSSTGNQFDMAIDGSKGMFVLQNSNGAQLYSRNGQFFADKENKIVNAQGQQLMGYAAGGTNLIGMTVPVGNIDPVATANLANMVNLDANAKVAATPETLGTLSLTTPAGETSNYYYRVAGGSNYIWTNSSGVASPALAPSAGSYNSWDTPPTQFTLSAGAPTPATFPATGGNIPGDAATVGTVQLADAAGTPTSYFYTVDAAGIYTWYTDVGGGTVANPGDAEFPADATYSTGGVTAAAVVINPTNQPTAVPPVNSQNVAYAASVVIPFSPTDPDSFSNATPITVYDSLGNEHRLTQYYTKRPAVAGNSVWEVNFRIDGQVPSAGGSMQLTFDPAGRLLAGAPSSQTVTLTAPGGGASPASPMNILVNYANSTQFGGGFTQNFVPDGYATGEYASTSVGTNGELIANYTNGAKKVMGTLALADFNNLQGLQSVGGNAWIETASSGQPILGQPGSNGLAVIKGQSVEESNVDMSQELVNMIIAQRTYQANAQTIKTQDQILQTLITMR